MTYFVVWSRPRRWRVEHKALEEAAWCTRPCPVPSIHCNTSCLHTASHFRVCGSLDTAAPPCGDDLLQMTMFTSGDFNAHDIIEDRDVYALVNLAHQNITYNG